MSELNVAAVILAAGASTRFGTSKQLLDWQGQPLITHIADIAWRAGLSPILVVLGAEADQIAPVLQGRPVHIVRNYRWSQGMSTSLNVGVAALPIETQAAIFLPVDQPLVTPALLRDLVATWQSSHQDIVIPVSQAGQRGTPVLFARQFFAELAQLSGDVGGRVLFSKYADCLTQLEVADAHLLTDADTPETYIQLQKYARHTHKEHLAEIRGIICDMDGVLWRGQSALPGLHEFFNLINMHNLGYVLVTNNSSKTPDMYVEKLRAMGVHTTPAHILTSALAAADYVTSVSLPSETIVYPIGGPGVLAALRARGFILSDGETADYVVVGWDQALTWEKLAIATRLIYDGAKFIGTNPDLTFPMEHSLAPGNGAQLAALEAATQVKPVVAGKPYPILYQQALARMGTHATQTLVIGDRLDTDILGGVRLSMPTAMMLSGISGLEQLKTSPYQPDMIFDNLAALVEAWRVHIT